MTICHHTKITNVQLDFRFIDHIMIVFNSSLARNRQLSFHARCDCYEIIMCRVMLARIRKTQRGEVRCWGLNDRNQSSSRCILGERHVTSIFPAVLNIRDWI